MGSSKRDEFLSKKKKSEIFVMKEINTYVSENLMVIMLLVVVVVVVAAVLGSGRIRFMWSTIESTIGYCEQGNESSVSTEGGEFLDSLTVY